MYRENLVALGGESCSSCWEVTLAFNFISERTVLKCIGNKQGVDWIYLAQDAVAVFWGHDNPYQSSIK
jgi:hypothetical protein